MLLFLKRLLRLTDGGQTTPPTLSPFDQGLVALSGNQYALAIAHFDAVLRQQPGNAAAYFGRGTAYSRLGEIDKAMADYTEAIRLAPNDAGAYARRGLSYNLRGELDNAIQDFTAALRLQPDERVYILRAVAYAKKRQHDLSIQDCDMALRLNATSAAAFTTRAVARADQRQYEQAAQDYERALTFNSEFEAAYGRFAWLLATCPREHLRDGKRALQYARKACALSSWDDHRNLETIAAAFAEIGHCAKAARWQRKALERQGYDEREAEEARMRLGLYLAGEPYRELDSDRAP